MTKSIHGDYFDNRSPSCVGLVTGALQVNFCKHFDSMNARTIGDQRK